MKMIEKVIHYCWFGEHPLTDDAQRCISSWKKYLPDYKIIEWNESNFDVRCCDYVEEAYQNKKWAFVSDYARFDILYKYGGLYFDTDVELIKNIDDIITKGSFFGIEKSSNEVAPGLGMGAVAGMDVYREILDVYQHRHFINLDGTMNQIVISKYTSSVLKKHGLEPENRLQYVAGIYIYPSEYFCPMDYNTGKLLVTANTRSVHYYTGTWHTKKEQNIQKFKQKMTLKFGYRVGYFLERCYSLPYRVKKKLVERGLKETVIFSARKIFGKENKNKDG